MASPTYEELHGINNWDGLLDPLNLSLRTTALRYGDLASAAEQAFNDDAGSKYCGYSRYGKAAFFQGVMLPWADSTYQISSFLYATASASYIPLLFPSMLGEGSELESNWMGYVAVSNDDVSRAMGRREICVVWRGTVRTYEWIDDILGAMPVSADPLLPSGDQATDNPQVMGGWLTIYTTSDPQSQFVKTSARTQLLGILKDLLAKHGNEKISITCAGHSLGATLAVLSAFDVATNVAATPDILVSAFAYACPQVGNQAFKTRVENTPNLRVLRVKNKRDFIPFWPSKLIKWVDQNNWVPVPSGLLDYVDVGVELFIDSDKSPYLKTEDGLGGMLHPLVFHNLQGMLHVLAGWNGEDGEFDWGLVKRSLGLVNMSTDFLKEEYQIPVSWWAEKNKGMVLKDDGDWVLSSPDSGDDDLPVR